jgi:hypothetical protein
MTSLYVHIIAKLLGKTKNHDTALLGECIRTLMHKFHPEHSGHGGHC